MDAERAVNKWWDDEINVNDLHGSLVAALDRGGYEIVKKRKPGRIKTADVRKMIGEPISVFDAAVAPARKFETR